VNGAAEAVQDQQGGGVGPLQVVDGDHQRAFSGQLLYQRQDRFSTTRTRPGRPRPTAPNPSGPNLLQEPVQPVGVVAPAPGVEALAADAVVAAGQADVPGDLLSMVQDRQASLGHPGQLLLGHGVSSLVGDPKCQPSPSVSISLATPCAAGRRLDPSVPTSWDDARRAWCCRAACGGRTRCTRQRPQVRTSARTSSASPRQPGPSRHAGPAACARRLFVKVEGPVV
jgi:hypothetical protein